MTVQIVIQSAETFGLSPLVIREDPKNYFHIHTYGGLSPFFSRTGGKRKLLGTCCSNPACREHRIWLPPRVHCPDLLCAHEPGGQVAPRGTLYTHSTVLYTRAAALASPRLAR